MQEIALAGLYRAGFFKEAAFYGGTCLRIFYGLPRFSEDLDFTLLKKSQSFSLVEYLPFLTAEFEALGMNVSVKEKPRNPNSQIESAFLKADTEWKELVLESASFKLPLTKPSLKIKIEVDVFPPLQFQTENKLLLKPFSFYVNCLRIEDLFAGKMHALLFRKSKSRVKGRDWFDLEWYIRKGVPINLEHFSVRAIESGDLTRPVDESGIRALLKQKIESLDFDRVKQDVVRFIPDPEGLDIWTTAYFLELVEKLKTK
ncbi:nucleotidyl transferase AbiEii/AbiGii toxin family protein [Mariniradius saccharolyticus]|nr:nucleotidyl transferase AbiEii/AbiGii toxin family protein [Mariniradius saccharolyticus]